MKMCYMKIVAESNTTGALDFKSQYPDINFQYCKKCHGDNPSCKFYELRVLDDIHEELIEDSSLIKQLEFPI